MNRTQRIEQAELDAIFQAERTKEPRYPIIERPEAAQLGQTIISFHDFDSEGRYIETHDSL